MSFAPLGVISVLTVQNHVATCFHGTAQIALIQLIRPVARIQGAFKIEMAMINIAIQEDLPNAIALVTRSKGHPNPVGSLFRHRRSEDGSPMPRPIHARHQSPPPDV